MTCLGPYEIMFYCYQILCFGLIIWMHTNYFIYSYSSLWNAPPPPQKFCAVYLNLTNYQMKP